MTVTGGIRIGPLGHHHRSRVAEDQACTVRLSDKAILASSQDTVYSSVDGGQTWDNGYTFTFNNQNSPGPGTGSSAVSPLLQRINARDGNLHAMFKLRYWTGSGPGAWGFYNMHLPVFGNTVGSLSPGSFDNWVPISLRSQRYKVPRAIGIDYISNVLSIAGHQWYNFSDYALLRPAGLSDENNRPGFRRIMNDYTFYEERKSRSGSRYTTYPKITRTLGLLQGWESGVYCSTLDGWFDPPAAQTGYFFVFDGITQSTWRLSADPGRLDQPIGPVVTEDWVFMGGIIYNNSVNDPNRFDTKYELIQDSSNSNPIAVSRYGSYADINSGWQVRHAMSGNKLYRWLKKGVNSSWEFIEMDAFGFEFEDRALLPPPTGGWTDYADTRFCVTPRGVIAVHISQTECKVSHWQKSANSWSGWVTVYTGKIRCYEGSRKTTTRFPHGTGIGCSRSTPGEYVDIVAQQRSEDTTGNDTTKNGLYYYRWNVDAAPDRPNILNIDNGETKSLNEPLTLEWDFSDPGGGGQTGFRVRRTTEDGIAYISYSNVTAEFIDFDTPEFYGVRTSNPDFSELISVPAYYYNANNDKWRLAKSVSANKIASKNITIGNSVWGGALNDGTTVWFIDDGNNIAKAYTASTGSRNSSKDIRLYDAAWTGGVFDGTTFWFIDFFNTKAAAYDSSGARDSSKDIDLPSARFFGAITDSTTLWFVEDTGNTAQAYVASTGARDASKDISLISGTWAGSFYNEKIMWFIDRTSDKAIAYNFSDYSRNEDRDISLGSNTIEGGTLVGDILWVVDTVLYVAVAYRLSQTWRESTFAGLNLGANYKWLGNYADTTSAGVAVGVYDPSKVYLADIANTIKQLSSYYLDLNTPIWSTTKSLVDSTSQTITLPSGWATQNGNVQFEVEVRDTGNRWSGWSVPAVVYADTTSPVTISGNSLSNITWAYPSSAEVHSYRVWFEHKNYIAKNPAWNRSTRPKDSYDSKRTVGKATSVAGVHLYNAVYTVYVEWWTQRGLKSKVASKDITVNLGEPGITKALTISTVDEAHNDIMGAGVGFSLKVDWNQNSAVTALSMYAIKRNYGGSNYNGWKVTAIPDNIFSGDDLNSSEIIDEIVQGGEEYEYAVVAIGDNGSKYVGPWVRSGEFKLRITRLTSKDSSDSISLRVSNFKRGHIANIKSSIFADGSQRYSHGFDYQQVGRLKISSSEFDVEEKWLIDRAGQEYVLRLPQGNMELVLIGDVDINHEAIQGDTTLFVPAFLTVYRFPGAVEL